jgi:hypothetical protein
VTRQVQQQFGVVLMKNLEKGAVTIYRTPLNQSRFFARFLQQNLPDDANQPPRCGIFKQR